MGSIATAQGWEGGVKSGVSRAGLTSGAEFDWSYAPTTAVFMRHSLTRLLAIQPELMYVRRTGISSIPGSTLTMTADNIEVPLMLTLQFPSAFGIAPYLSGGPSFAVRLRCRLQFLGGGLRSNEDCENGGAKSSRVDLGVAGGAGLAWTLGLITLVMETRASAGLRTYVLPIDARDARSASWSLLAGVSMPINRRRMLPATPTPGRFPALGPQATDFGGPIPVPAAALTDVPGVPGFGVSSAVAPSRRRLTISADNVDVREILDGIARETGYKVVVATQVQKRVTAALFDVSAEEAVRVIVETAGLRLLQPAVPGQAPMVVQNRIDPVPGSPKRTP